MAKGDKYQYNEGKLIQVANMEKPDDRDYWESGKFSDGVEGHFFHDGEFERDMRKYNDHLASLNPTPIVVEQKADHWKDGQILEEGERFKFIYQKFNTHHTNDDWQDCDYKTYSTYADTHRRIIARPIPDIDYDNKPEGCTCGDGKRAGRNLMCSIHGDGRNYTKFFDSRKSCPLPQQENKESMKKDIKDYLHYYLGCECIIGDVNWKPQNIAPEDRAPYTDPNYGVPVRTILTLHVIQQFAHKTTIILRPLSDMTEDETMAVLKILWGHQIKDTEFGYQPYDASWYEDAAEYVYITFKSKWLSTEESVTLRIYDKFRPYLTWNQKDGAHNITPIGKHDVTIYFLKQGFDIFSLIESGLANDKTLQP